MTSDELPMPFGIRARSRIQQNPSGIDAGSRDNDALAENAMLFFGVAIEVLHAVRRPRSSTRTRATTALLMISAARFSAPVRSGNRTS